MAPLPWQIRRKKGVSKVIQYQMLTKADIRLDQAGINRRKRE
jgi:hypothetical protein